MSQSRDADEGLNAEGVARIMGERLASTVGVAACLAVLAVVAWPYLEAPGLLVEFYYGSGPTRVTTAGVLTPTLVALLAVGALAAFVAGRFDAVSDETAAGAAVGFGLLAFGVSLAWAVTARVDPFLAPGVLLPNQRWMLVAATAIVAAAASWYARELDVV